MKQLLTIADGSQLLSISINADILIAVARILFYRSEGNFCPKSQSLRPAGPTAGVEFFGRGSQPSPPAGGL